MEEKKEAIKPIDIFWAILNGTEKKFANEVMKRINSVLYLAARRVEEIGASEFNLSTSVQIGQQLDILEVQEDKREKFVGRILKYIAWNFKVEKGWEDIQLDCENLESLTNVSQICVEVSASL